MEGSAIQLAFSSQCYFRSPSKHGDAHLTTFYGNNCSKAAFASANTLAEIQSEDCARRSRAASASARLRRPAATAQSTTPSEPCTSRLKDWPNKRAAASSVSSHWAFYLPRQRNGLRFPRVQGPACRHAAASPAKAPINAYTCIQVSRPVFGSARGSFAASSLHLPPWGYSSLPSNSAGSEPPLRPDASKDPC
jgi:hypothetical protein